MNRYLTKPAPAHSITAFILAGGQSRRMGTDKAFLSYRNQPLIHCPIRICQSFTKDVRIIGDPARYSCFGLPVIPDIGRSLGPLSGIHAALRHSPTDLSSVIACDMPLMRPEFFELMLQKFPGPDAVVMRFDDGALEPLCGIYSSSCLATAERSLANGDLKISDLLAGVAVDYINEAELEANGLSRRIFTNVNTPDDLRHLES